MSPTRSFRRLLLTAAATGSVLLATQGAMAQTVRMFEEAPSLEQLRSIMIPESRGGTSRTIVMQRPDTSMARPATAVQRATTQVEDPAPVMAQPAPIPETTPARPVVRSAAPVVKATAAAPVQDAVADAGIVGFRINFGFDSADLPANARTFIERIAELLRQEPQVKLRIEGHTDATGAPGYNQNLSERRALSVAEYLVNQMGISPDRLELVGKGMAEPVAQDPYAPQNRRVQFVRIG
jgi:outer membrane protein OmpA-like peptidoglycan-associated protein